jgi:hypothetical protein
LSGGEKPNEIEECIQSQTECAKPDWTRRFIRSLAEDAKFEENRESSSTQAVDAGFGATRRRRDGQAGRCGNRGDSGNHQSAPREREFGATRKLKPKAKPEGVARGATRKPTGRRSRKAKLRGNPKLQLRKRRRTRNSG